MKHSLVFIILILLLSFASAELVTTDFTISTSCGETQFMEINEGGFEYLLYNNCQEWRFPQLLTNIKTTFKEEQLNAKVIPINISEMNQNGTPNDYSDDYPVRTLAISSINVTPQFGGSDKRLEWHTYYVPETVDIALYYKLKDNAGKWGLELDGWDFDSPTNYILLRNQIFSGGAYVDFDCSNVNTTRGCDFLDSDDESFSKLYFDYPVNDGDTYNDGDVWYNQQGQNHNLYQDLGRGDLIILDPTITSGVLNIFGFVNSNNKNQCGFIDGNMFCVAPFSTQDMKLFTGSLPDLNDFTTSDFNFTPRANVSLTDPIMLTDDKNMYFSYSFTVSGTNREILMNTATSNYMTLGSWFDVNLTHDHASVAYQNASLDLNSSGDIISGVAVESTDEHYLTWCTDCAKQSGISNELQISPLVSGSSIYSGLFIDDNNYVVMTGTNCELGFYNRPEDRSALLQLISGTACDAGALKVVNNKLYTFYTNNTTNIGFVRYVSLDKNIEDLSLWSSEIQFSANFPRSISPVFLSNTSSADFNSIVIAYSEGGTADNDHNRFVGYKKMDTVTDTFDSNFQVVDQNVEDYSESRSTDAYFDSLRNAVYILFNDFNSNNINPSAFVEIVHFGIAGTLTADFNASPALLVDLNRTFDFNDISTFTDVNAFSHQWDINGTTFSTDQNTTRSLTVNIDYNICMTISGTAHDGNAIISQACQVISPEAGNIKMFFTDENSGAVLPTVTGNFNGSPYSVDSNGFVKFDLAGLPAGTYAVTASDANRSTRFFNFFVEPSDIVEVNATLVEDTRGNLIQFQFFGTDETTLLDDANVTILNLTNGRTVSRLVLTDSLGRATFFLNPDDPSYSIQISDDTGSVTYGAVDLIVKSPKRESDGSVITPISFDVSLSGISSQSVTDASGDVTFQIYGNTAQPYKVNVDVNSEFFDRTYEITAIGDLDPVILQPYLVGTGVGVSTKIVTQSSIDFAPIGGVEIDIFKFVSGEGIILVESIVTDDKGEAFISGIVNDSYTFEVTYLGEQIAELNIIVTSSVVFIQFDPSDTTVGEIDAILGVTFDPGVQNLTSDNNFLTQTANIQNGTINWMRIRVFDVNNSLVNGYDVNLSTGINPTAENIINISADIPSWDQNTSITVVVTVDYNGFNQDFNMTYFGFREFIPGEFVLDLLRFEILSEFGCTKDETCGPLVIIALLLTVFISGVLVVVTPLRNPVGVVGLSSVFMSIFVFLGWVPFFWFIIFVFIGFAGALAVWRVT